MKILLLCWRDTGHPEGGGSERYLERVAAYLAEQGHSVVYRTAAYPDAPKISTRDGVTFSRAGGNFSVYVRAWAAMAGARFGIGPIAKALGGKPDVVVDTQNGVPFFARVFSGAPTVLLTHHCHREQWPVAGPVISKLGWFIESRLSPMIHRRCRYITVSEPSAAELVGLGVSSGRISVIRNGVDPIPEEVLATAGVADLSECKGPAPHLVTLSRLVPHKQIEHAIDVLVDFVQDHPGAILDVIGSGWWHDNLVEYARDKGVSDHVIFHGQVTEEEKHRILSGACLHLMPSRKEGWGLAVIESAQHGVPTVGYSSSAGLRDSVNDGETGLLASDHADLIAKTRQILDDEALHHRMSEACVARAAEFGWDKTAAAVLNVLEHPALD
ncbi:MAG: glycosyltransferase family 4 protein [Corynebacterium sp.]|uniref:glycosyltransferase family 4 protein n=1 Tax=Corynebacterium sp. TaxID=1720 RepID=UPI0026DC2995|nr:glycosyltransferase family 4 protein [Corynebacterium sp.]MDO5029905.1 glycosyltransferase family 4 protein [Corynebacterium sp.]